MKKSIIIWIISFAFSGVVYAAANGVALSDAKTNIHDTESLKNGAKLFMNYCSGCHAIGFIRYSRIGKDLGMSEDEVRKELIFSDAKIDDPITHAMSKSDSESWFGITPPDLSLVSRAKGVDWVYSYLKGFYPDESKALGVNNRILAGTAMPDVLWALREKSKSTPEVFDNQVRDIVNFLDYVGEPVQLVRYRIGIKVLIFLSILLVLAVLLKNEYWKDVKYGKWRAKN